MIFQLECTAQELASASREELEVVFSKLIDADRSGKHFMVSRRDLCEWAAGNLEMSRRDRAHLVSVREKYAVRGNLLEEAQVYVKVTIGNDGISFDGNRIFSIGHTRLISGEYVSTKSGFVVEDVDADGELYGHVLREVRRVTKVPSFSYDPIHGGGSKTHRVFEREIGKRRVVVCVVDHDRLAPMDRMSATARKVVGIYERRNLADPESNQCFIGLGIETVGREAENIIPYGLFRYMENYRNQENFEKLDSIVKEREGITEDKNFWLYFDVKNGLNGAKLSALYGDGNVSLETITWICDRTGCNVNSIDEVHIDGFGKNVIAEFLSSPRALSGFHKFVRTEYWRRLFVMFFEKLLWYFAAPESARV